MPTSHLWRPMPALVTTALFATSLVSAAAPSRDRIARVEPKATDIAGAELGGLLGWSPMPTQAPMGPPADLELRKRYDKGSDTCGFADGYKSDPWTCYALGATCTVWSDYIGCCATSGVCSSTMISACYDYTDVQAGSCASADSHTLCCTDKMPSCWAWISTTSTNPDLTMTAFNCQANGGTGILWEAPPILTMTSGGSTLSNDPSTATTPETTETSAPGSGGSGAGSGSDTSTDNGNNSNNNNSNSHSNVGAIVGGVVGGLAVVALVVGGVAVYLWRKRKNGKPDAAAAALAGAGSGQQPQMMQNGQSGMMAPPPGDQHGSYYQQPGGYYDPAKISPGPGPYSPSMYGSTVAGQTPPPGQPGLWQQGPPGYAQTPQGYGQGQQWGAQPPASQYHAPPQEMAGNPADTQLGSMHNRAELS